MNRELLEQKKQIILGFMGEENYIPMKLKELCYMLQVSPEEKYILVQVLDELVKEGRVEQTKKGKYLLSSAEQVAGIFDATQRGFGFVRVEGAQKDIFIPETEVNGAFHSDEVLVEITDRKEGSKKSMEGRVIKILNRGIKTLVGTFDKNKNSGFVVPDNQKIPVDIYIPATRTKGAVSGHKVVVKLVDYGKKNKKPEGIVTEILGHVNDPGTDIMSVVKAYEIPVAFSNEVRNEVRQIPDHLMPEDYRDRLDLRHLQTVTIDGEDAKDLDDAITLYKDETGYHLGVHIADVSHYVQEGTALDREAFKRGTSVYLVNKVIPMLPQELSNGICSLNEGQDRLALSCIMDLDHTGKIQSHRIANTVINVDRRMTYTAVNAVITDHNLEVMKEYKELVPMFEMMGELSGLLREKRRQRGSIDFDFPESKIILDESGHPIEIRAYERNAATKLIEDFMLLANETVAEDYFWQEIPFVYRTHESPDGERVARLEAMIRNFGYVLKAGTSSHIHPKEIQKLLGRIEGTPEEPMISRLALRSMKQAKYTTLNVGHFGLSASYYCHFTSPIRRYPDLQIHRIIKENMRGGIRKRRLEWYEEHLPGIADQCSRLERRAEEAEREVVKLKKVEYMADKVGQSFVGVISGITSWGIYVELPNTVEGMVSVHSLLDDYYFYDEEKYVMMGRNTGRIFQLGEKVEIRVAGVDKMSKTIDFELAEFYLEDDTFSEIEEIYHLR
ncbi:MAG: ribonuclease R [Lachnospiraceae bacterium]|nr:ribonuclease R [Lachnospiraceae bacterium]